MSSPRSAPGQPASPPARPLTPSCRDATQSAGVIGHSGHVIRWSFSCRSRILGALALAAVALGGCGSGESDAGDAESTSELQEAADATLAEGFFRGEEFYDAEELFATTDYDVDGEGVHRVLPGAQEIVRIGDIRFLRLEGETTWQQLPATGTGWTVDLLRSAVDATEVRALGGNEFEFAIEDPVPLGFERGDLLRMRVDSGRVIRIEFVGSESFVELSRFGVDPNIAAPAPEDVTEGSIPEVEVCTRDPQVTALPQCP